jgi:hypothetical protein
MHLASSSSSSSLGPSADAPEAPQPWGLLCTLIQCQHRFSNPVTLIKRHRSLTEAVLISFGSIWHHSDSLTWINMAALNLKFICTNLCHDKIKILLPQCNTGQFTWRSTHILLLQVTKMCHKGIVVQHEIFLYSWQWHVAQHTQKALSCFHCNSGYTNGPQCYIIFILPIFLNFLSSVFQVAIL